MFLEVEEGGQDRDEEAVKVYLIKFIADLINAASHQRVVVVIGCDPFLTPSLPHLSPLENS